LIVYYGQCVPPKTV